MSSLTPVFYALAVLGLLGLGALFGAAITESECKRKLARLAEGPQL